MRLSDLFYGCSEEELKESGAILLKESHGSYRLRDQSVLSFFNSEEGIPEEPGYKDKDYIGVEEFNYRIQVRKGSKIRKIGRKSWKIEHPFGEAVVRLQDDWFYVEYEDPGVIL